MATVLKRPFLATDALEIDPQDAQSDFLSNFNDTLRKDIEASETSYTFTADDEIISVCGVVPIGKVGFIWCVNSKSFKHYAREICRHIRAYLNSLEEEGSLTSFKATVVDGFKAGFRWIEMLGFKRTGHNDGGFYEYERLI